MTGFVTINATLSEEAFDYLYQYAKRMSLDVNSALDSLILFDETPISNPVRTGRELAEGKSRYECRVMIGTILKDGDKPSQEITKTCLEAGFSNNQINRSMKEVSQYYYRGASCYRKLSVSLEEIVNDTKDSSECSICGNKITGIEKSGMCPACQTEYRRVITNNARARRLGLKCDLTISEWAVILKEHEYKCSYCGSNFEELDHIIPLSKGGETTKINVTPSCKKCNREKIMRDTGE